MVTEEKGKTEEHEEIAMQIREESLVPLSRPNLVRFS